MSRAEILSTAIIVVLGMAATADAAEHWRGGGGGAWPVWGGDGTSWNDALNWDDSIPSATSWDANSVKDGIPEQGTPSNYDIYITESGTCGLGTIANYSGYTVNLTVEDGFIMTNSGDLNYYSAGLFTIKSGATYRMAQFALDNSGLAVSVENNGTLRCNTLRHNGGAKIEVYGTLWATTVSRIANDPGYKLAVYDGGVLQIDSGVPATGGWAKGGKVTQYIGSTLMLAGDQTGHYLDLVQAGEDGAWAASYDSEYTYITLKPCNPVVFADVDNDGDVDQSDFSAFQLCFTGEGGGVPVTPDYCQCFDRRNNDNTSGEDDDIDGFDLQAFEDCASAPGVPAGPCL